MVSLSKMAPSMIKKFPVGGFSALGSIDVTIPSVIEPLVKNSVIDGVYNARKVLIGYCIDLQLPPLGLYKNIKSADHDIDILECKDILKCKVEETLRLWGQKYERYLEAQESERKAADVEEMNAAAKELLAKLQSLLAYSLTVKYTANWASIQS